MKRVAGFLPVFLGLMVCCAWSTAADLPAHEERLAWWRDARFGMFIT